MLKFTMTRSCFRATVLQRGVSSASSALESERLSKILARSGVASRREAENLIKGGAVSVNGRLVTSPSQKGVVAILDDIEVQGFGILPKTPPGENLLAGGTSAKIWAVSKARGELMANKDNNKNRPLLFDRIRRLINYDVTLLKPVDRMDFNVEGLALLTNHGGLSRIVERELASQTSTYRVRVHGLITQSKMLALQRGIYVDGVKHNPLKVKVDRSGKSTISWLTISAEGANAKAIKSIFDKIHLRPLRIIRTEYGPFSLAGLPAGALREQSLPPFLAVKWRASM